MGENTNPDLIHCKCNHLTSFASDFLVAPNPIDFDKVFSADLSKNPAVLIVVCLIFGLYLLLVVIARRYDNKDLDKVRNLRSIQKYACHLMSFTEKISIYHTTE